MERVSIEMRQTGEYDGMRPIVIGQVIRLRSILQQPIAVFETESDDECPGFRRRMARQPRHEATANLQDGGPVVPGRCFDVGQ